MASEDTNSVFKFANSDLSDVIFDVGGKEFHCHKMFLAVKSDYFSSMFASGFKEKEQERITIEADPDAFKLLLEILYYGYIENAELLFVCSSHGILKIPHPDFQNKLWNTANDLFALADRFLLIDVVRKSFELLLICYDRDCPYEKKGCTHCAVKLLLSLCHKMEKYKKISVSCQAAIKYVLRQLSGDIQLNGDSVAFLLERD